VKALRARLSPGTGFAEYYAALYRDGAEGWARSEAALLELKQQSRARGFDLAVVLLPELHQLVDYTFRKEHEIVMDFLRLNEICTLDLAAAFANERDPHSLWVSLDDAHPTARSPLDRGPFPELPGGGTRRMAGALTRKYKWYLLAIVGLYAAISLWLFVFTDSPQSVPFEQEIH
jgi:hypothetical protein